MDFRDKHFLITGASRGLGYSLTKLLLEKGAARLTLWARSIDALEKIKSSYPKCDIRIEEVDVRQVCEIEKAAAKIDDSIPLCGVINCAGASKLAFLKDITEEMFDDVVGTNFKGTLFVCKHTVPYLKKNGGSIINIASVSAKTGDRTLGIYGSSKAAVISLTQTLAKELAGANIRVNCVCPGAMQTEMFYKESIQRFADMFKIEPEKLIEGTKNAILQKRILPPEEVAETIAFLLSDSAKGITGQSINVDAGFEFH